MARFQILSEEQIKASLKDLPEWKVVENNLKAEYVFPDFRMAFAFITLIAIESEKMNHHPKWSNVYNKVQLSLLTHDAGDKVTDLDVQMAEYISKIAKQFQ